MRTILWALVAVGIIFIAACDETTGLAGKNSLIKMTDVPAGDICPDGGIKIETGIDNNGNAMLDPQEVKDIRYVCNGGGVGLDGTGCTVADNEDGTKTITCGDDTTVTVSDGAAGADGEDCTVSDSGNGTKTITCGDTEVTVTDGGAGAAGHNSLVVIEDAPDGTCPNGGQKVTIGIDQNDNGALDTEEITATKYICAGVDGNDSLTVIDPVDPGDDCAASGYEIKNGVDTDNNGTLDAGEVVSDVFVCNGVDGTDGQNGADGHNALTEVTTLAPGDGGCVAGGYLFKTGVDLNDNGLLDDGEYEETVVCNGVDGVDGEDGVCAGNNAPVITGITIDPPDGIGDTYKLDMPYTVTVTVTDADGDAPTYKLIGGYATIAAGATAGEFELTPRAEGGPFSYAVIVSDGCQITMGDLVVEAVSGDPSGGPYFMGPPVIWLTDITGSGFTANWNTAHDDMTAEEDLEYKVVYATDPDEIDTIAEIEAGGGTLVMDWTADTFMIAITGLDDGTDYWVAVLVRDEYHLMAMYNLGYQQTPDVTAPTTTGGISFEDIDTGELTVLWTPATDNTTEPEFIEYKVVYSTDAADIDTETEVNDLMGGDWRVLVDWQTEVYDYYLSGLDEGDLYHFNVLARDTMGNVFMYGAKSVRTTDITVPADIANPYAVGLNDRACFRWDDLGDFSLAYYEVTWTPGGPTEPLQVPADSFVRCIDGLMNGTAYTFTVVAVDGIDQRSGEVTITATPADPGMGYAITGGSSSPSYLYSFDPSTAEITLVGDTGTTHSIGLAINPQDDTLYMLHSDTSSGEGTLFTLDTATGVPTLIGPLGSDLTWSTSLAFDSFGTLYAFIYGDPDLITIDTATGDADYVGNNGLGSGAYGIAFASDGTMYMKSGNALYTVDKFTGTGALVGDIDVLEVTEDGSTYDNMKKAFELSKGGIGFSVVYTDTTSYLYAFSLGDRMAIPIGDMGVYGISALALEHDPFDQMFSGIKREIPEELLTDWTVCYTDTYDVVMGSVITDILTNCDGDNLMIACRPAGADTYTVAAWAPRADVLFDTGTDQTTTHAANGVEWYYNAAWSWGFAPAGETVGKDSCDATAGASRLCWHTEATYGGYRCGGTLGLNSDSSWERVVLQYTPE